MDEVMKVTTDHDEIRRWAEKYGGRPQLIEETSTDENLPGIRIDFPGKDDDTDLPEAKVRNISWDEFFKEFEAEKLAFMYVDNVNPKDPLLMKYAYRFIKRDVLHEKSEEEVEDLLKELFDSFMSRY